MRQIRKVRSFELVKDIVGNRLFEKKKKKKFFLKKKKTKKQKKTAITLVVKNSAMASRFLDMAGYFQAELRKPPNSTKKNLFFIFLFFKKKTFLFV